MGKGALWGQGFVASGAAGIGAFRVLEETGPAICSVPKPAEPLPPMRLSMGGVIICSRVARYEAFSIRGDAHSVRLFFENGGVVPTG